MTKQEGITCFKMRREGQFLAKWSREETKCGPAEAQPIYQYACDIVAAPELNDSGFIIDNLEVHRYFLNTYGTRPLPAISCERMAAHGVKSIKRMCETEGVTLISISVSVSGMTGAWLTAEWRNDAN